MSGQQPQGPRFRTWSDLSGRTQLRIGDIEREAAVTALGEHYATGRLSKEEYDERATVAYEARTLAALQPLFADLPLPHGPLQPAAPTYRPGPGPGARASRPRGVPWFPVIVLAIGLALLTGKFFLFWLVILGAWFFTRSRRARGREQGSAHTSGSCFGGRGSWR